MDIQHFSELIKHAGSILWLSHGDIENKYVNYPICIMKHIEKGVCEDIIEIRFDEQEVTLATTFDNDNICNLVLLFPDKIGDIDQIIIYLNDRFNYNYLKSHWLLSNCSVKIKKSKEGIVFAFYC
ncbi:hypothetical protein CLV62_1199 [Dysgonomonas alginatilytica]|uniref:Uncharacterized protein n=1 Tax=Dysgonomonas alginatilytica TaxID=1605892 RepID=A0A2V3PLB1_9BACT|nr:hypothetical protein [Dysgonomonas alginatilytica]PXV62469.1 hypothetical protein CLV62_1199 [Dysgonomonas alginatilytica]